MEVLLTLDGSRKELVLTSENAGDVIKTEIENIASIPSDTITLVPFDRDNSDEKAVRVVYILQRWSEKWSDYVDMRFGDELKDGDKLSLLKQVQEHKSVSSDQV